MTPTIIFNPCNPDVLETYIDEFIITNHNNEIIAIQHNNIENGLLTLIKAAPVNYNKATVRTTAGTYSPTCDEYILIFRVLATGTITLMDNRWNEWIIDNQTTASKQLIGSINKYWNTSGVLMNYIPSKSVVRLAKGNDNNWYQINQLSSNAPIVSPPIAGSVGDAGLPQVGDNTYTDIRLVGLGSSNNGNITFTMAGATLYNYGGTPSFELDNVEGTITLLYDNTFQEFDAINIPLNQ